MTEWIKCSDRMPEQKVQVIVYDGFFSGVGYLYRNFWNSDTEGNPTHWMPLPAPPEEE